MSDAEITQVSVEGRPVGVVGLGKVLEELAAEGFAQRSDEAVGEAMLARLTPRNYIPAPARDKYGRAFAREFRRFSGQAVKEEDGGLIVKVFGPGCAQCERLTRDVMDVLAELKLPADLRHVTDIKEIAKSGVMGTPALMIDGKVAAAGSVPPKARIRGWLEKYKKRG